MSKFAQAIIAEQVVTQGKGSRIVGSTEPELTLLPTVNQFSINPAGCALMGLNAGETVTISMNPGAENVNEMFAIHKTPAGNGAKTAASTDDGNVVNLKFNLANVYAVMLKGIVGQTVESVDNLRKVGLVKGKTATKKVYYTLVKADGLYAINEKGILVVATEGMADTFAIYELVDRHELPYTPREKSEKTGDNGGEETANVAADVAKVIELDETHVSDLDE